MSTIETNEKETERFELICFIGQVIECTFRILSIFIS